MFTEEVVRIYSIPTPSIFSVTLRNCVLIRLLFFTNSEVYYLYIETKSPNLSRRNKLVPTETTKSSIFIMFLQKESDFLDFWWHRLPVGLLATPSYFDQVFDYVRVSLDEAFWQLGPNRPSISLPQDSLSRSILTKIPLQKFWRQHMQFRSYWQTEPCFTITTVLGRKTPWIL